jgi:hypothetical protein
MADRRLWWRGSRTPKLSMAFRIACSWSGAFSVPHAYRRIKGLE